MASYAGPVIDAHFHLWSLAGDHYPWLRPGGQLGRVGRFDSLKHDYLPADYARDIAGQNVVASVHIEALWDPEDDPVAETQWLESLDRSGPLAVRYVAAAPFGQDRTEEVLRRQARFDRVVGIRQVVAWNPDPSNSMIETPHLVRDRHWREALPLLTELGLLLELLIYPWQADEVAELAAAYPELTVVVNHIASPVDPSPAGMAHWRRGIAVLAAVQGYLPDPTDEAIADVVRRVVDAFGSERSMMASDFPVGGMEQSFAAVFRQYRGSVEYLDAVEQFNVFCGTAARIYSIPLADIGVVRPELAPAPANETR
jgi:predicted TIM-barrel fold metal-dependent hydrolase